MLLSCLPSNAGNPGFWQGKGTLANLKAAMPKDALAAMWTEVEFGTILDKELLDLLKRQAAWILQRNTIKAVMPSEAAFREAFADGPLKAVAPANVKLQ